MTNVGVSIENFSLRLTAEVPFLVHKASRLPWLRASCVRMKICANQARAALERFSYRRAHRNTVERLELFVDCPIFVSRFQNGFRAQPISAWREGWLAPPGIGIEPHHGPKALRAR